MNMYDGPGAVSVEITLTMLRLPYTERRAPASNSQCGVFRALQGWTSLSTTGADEGTLRVYPAIQESSAYMMMRPFFK